MSFKGRILSLDLGRRRVGLALTDELLISAQPLPPLEIRGIPDLMKQLFPIITQNNVTALVVGRPARLDGSDTHLTCFVDKVKSRLEGEFKLPVYLYDERFTSKIAQQSIHLAGQKLKDNKKALDSISASIILSDFLKLHVKKDSD
ncbi:MAG: Holliday junction resolvase RuvX [Candidatus Edwardsbacteria bacterium]|nr:Holliday junction resolvase RuvX [Candidatus Edwardsbacteria bacterium]MBU1576336.1 Holliday junction resolvase RuvX [Candidatus Edwardsbacteria bacterium]MBU2462889.1 Holliday junction resolvase RuvX [Candidatus Edwardsbacteria bacterium]MBU2593948.1 Holliday junction resolvase RuvX [Candidatus Edwardsbacteria bacterium]